MVTLQKQNLLKEKRILKHFSILNRMDTVEAKTRMLGWELEISYEAWFHWEPQITNAKTKLRTGGKAGAQETGEGTTLSIPTVSQRPMCQKLQKEENLPSSRALWSSVYRRTGCKSTRKNDPEHRFGDVASGWIVMTDVIVDR